MRPLGSCCVAHFSYSIFAGCDMRAYLQFSLFCFLRRIWGAVRAFLVRWPCLDILPASFGRHSDLVNRACETCSGVDLSGQFISCSKYGSMYLCISVINVFSLLEQFNIRVFIEIRVSLDVAYWCELVHFYSGRCVMWSSLSEYIPVVHSGQIVVVRVEVFYSL